MNFPAITSVWVIVVLIALVLFLMMGVLAKMFRKAGPHEALIVYGFRGTRIVQGSGTIIFPMVESCRELSLELMSFDVAIDPHRSRTIPDQDARPARRVDPPGDGGPPARHYRAIDGRTDRQGAGNGRGPHALDLRGRHEQDGT